MYIRLLTLVDDYGRYDGRIAVLHAHCFALRPDIKPQRTATLRSELHANKLIRIYVVDRKEYVQILRWKEHARGTRSKYPSENDNPQESAADRSEAQESATSLVPRSSIIVPSTVGKSDGTNGSSPTSMKSDEEWLKHLSEDKTYLGIDVLREHGKMVNWCNANHKQPTRKRFTNWLNRAEAPMNAQSKIDGWKSKTKILN